MKKFFKIIIALLIISAVAGIWYWQFNKKRLLKQLIQNTVSGKTDSLYYVKYDSSMVDEIAGNAYFRNVYLQSDSLQAELLHNKDSLPNVLINVFVKSIEANGIDIPSAVNGDRLMARKIVLDSPRIVLTYTGAGHMAQEDTLALYKKILGKFNAINADDIEIRHGTFISKHLNGDINVEIKNAQAFLTKLIVDSTKDYTNVISYFIKNANTEAESILINRPANKGTVKIRNAKYEAQKRSVTVEEIISNDETKIHKLRFDDININDFVEKKIIDVGRVSTESGEWSIYINKKPDSNTSNATYRPFDFPDDFFEEIKIGAVRLTNTTLYIREKSAQKDNPVVVSNLNFSLLDDIKITERNTLRKIINDALWQANASSVSMLTKDKIYKITLDGLLVNKQKSEAKINSVKVTPLVTQSQFVQMAKYQKDYYKIAMNNILLQNLNINKFINENRLEAQQASLSLFLDVFNDRMLPVNTNSKVGKYPHQLLLKIKQPVYIGKAIVTGSYIAYSERARETEKIGKLEFSNVNGTVENITNIKERIAQNNICRLTGTGSMLQHCKVSTEWLMYLNAANGRFDMKCELSQMDMTDFNTLTKPLANTEVTGTLNRLNFILHGDDHQANGNVNMLYNNLKVQSYKYDLANHKATSDKLKSFVGNMLVKNNNPSNGNTRTASFQYERDIYKSMFNLVWKSVYDGAQKIFLDKPVAELKKKIVEKKKASK